jgi:hypothetical protein
MGTTTRRTRTTITAAHRTTCARMITRIGCG